MEIISKRLKELRESVGLSQNKLGKISGMKQSSINRHENGTATPVASTSITMVEVAGYRFKDYFRVSGLVGVIGLATAWISIVLLYGLAW